MHKWRWMLTVLGGLAWSAASGADLVMYGHSVTGAFGMPLSSQEQLWIHNSSLRRDFMDRGRAYTHLFDLSKKQAIIIDHFTRTAEQYDLALLDAKTEASAPASGLKLRFEPTGKERPLQNWNCREFDIAASMPARLGNEETVFSMKGTVWVASGVPEEAAIQKLVHETRKPGFFLAIPAMASVTPSHARMLSEVIRKLSTKGLPCAAEVEGSYEGSGPLVNLARKMPSRMSLTFQKFSSDPIKPEMFMIPPGYQLVQRQPPVMSLQ